MQILKLQKTKLNLNKNESNPSIQNKVNANWEYNRGMCNGN